MIGPEAVRDLVPGIRGDFRGAMDTPSNGKADPARTTRAFYDTAQANGAEAVPAHGVDEIVVAEGRVEGVRIGDVMHKSRVVICAAWAGSSRLLRKLGILFPQDPIRPRGPHRADAGNHPALPSGSHPRHTTERERYQARVLCRRSYPHEP